MLIPLVRLLLIYFVNNLARSTFPNVRISFGVDIDCDEKLEIMRLPLLFLFLLCVDPLQIPKCADPPLNEGTSLQCPRGKKNGGKCNAGTGLIHSKTKNVLEKVNLDRVVQCAGVAGENRRPGILRSPAAACAPATASNANSTKTPFSA